MTEQAHDAASQTVEKLTRLRQTVQSAKAVPMSASCMLNRADLLGIIDGVLAELPDELERSRAVISERYASNAHAREQAEQIITAARSEARELASVSAVARLADEHADTVRHEAAQEAVALRVEADRYIDARLAEFEAQLQKTIGQVEVMRRRLSQRSHLDESDVEALPSI